MTEQEVVALLGPAAIAAADRLVDTAPAFDEHDRAILALLLRADRPNIGSTPLDPTPRKEVA